MTDNKSSDNTSKTTEETFKVDGGDLLQRIKEIIHEGNVRKITILDKNNKELMSFPLTVGVIGVALAPIFVAVGAMAALLTECTIKVEKEL